MYLFLSCLLLFGVVSVTVYLFILSSTRKKNPDSLKLPPGNLGWPVVGETLEFASSCRKDCYRKFFADRMSKYSPVVFKTSILREKVAVLCGPAGNKFVFSNENKLLVSWWPAAVDKIVYSDSDGSSGGVENSDSSSSSMSSSEGKNFRALLLEVLRPEALHEFVPIIHSMAKQQFKREWIPNEKVKVHPLSKMLTFALSCCLFVGVEDPELIAKIETYYADVAAGLFSLPVDLPGTAMNRGIKAAKAIKKELLPVIKQRRNQLSGIGDISKPDLLSRFVTKTDEDGRPFTDVHIADQILGLLVASHDTTSSVMTFVVYYLADHPHVYDRVLEEQLEILKSKGPTELLRWEDIQKMKYSRNVINEVLRMTPPAIGSFKEAKADISYAGYTIPKDWKVFWCVHASNRNPEYFSNPDKFDPTRFEGNGPPPFAFAPFGGGPRMCPGSEFARLEILIFMHCLVTSFRWQKLVPNEKITCTLSPLPANGLPIRLIPHEFY